MPKIDDRELQETVLNMLKFEEPFTTANEVSVKCELTPQKASGVLRKMENAGEIFSKKVKAGRGELKIYYYA